MLAETFNEMSIAIFERDKKLSRLNEELKQMSAGLAHEVRNPLNGGLGKDALRNCIKSYFHWAKKR